MRFAFLLVGVWVVVGLSGTALADDPLDAVRVVGLEPSEVVDVCYTPDGEPPVQTGDACMKLALPVVCVEGASEPYGCDQADPITIEVSTT